ncbi:MAG: UDP-3-O-(3-hydroxymyristoyl)glucosamine N-acyltransferase [Gammaproteobacteria bacterium]|nr:UDP-3-O-(3-hydroxymyristoyl)glucosamine N-acyltransferase [Gammaproteobacteria bacterium]MDD9815168.1 UDP-3-O-(3-hydroxymyristoyl)glucosamine N-acyltransferase [Gammaproteobacteria bacterium]MDD9870208.1 UDP-3-O-(3-hydroxymyristoyl)glucosamine N-acyltransferase [Gammaproteobacteria bacterium]
MLNLGELANRTGAEPRGDRNLVLRGIASLHRAGPADLSFFVKARGRAIGEVRTNAGAVVMDAASASAFNGNCLVHAEPYKLFARAAAHLVAPAASGVHPAAVVEEGAILGAGVTIGAGAFIGAGCSIGDCSMVDANATIYPGTVIGRRTVIAAGCVIGAPGFGWIPDGGAWLRFPQQGRVRIGDDVDLGANTCIDRGALDETVIGDGVKMDNMVHIAHNCIIGEHTIMAGFTGVAGSTVIGKRCQFGGRASVGGHLSIADEVNVCALSLVNSDITQPGTTWSNAIEARPRRRWNRTHARLHRLDEIAKRLRALERP